MKTDAPPCAMFSLKYHPKRKKKKLYISCSLEDVHTPEFTDMCNYDLHAILYGNYATIHFQKQSMSAFLSMKETRNKSLAYENREAILPPGHSFTSKIQSIFLQGMFKFKNLEDKRVLQLSTPASAHKRLLWSP